MHVACLHTSQYEDRGDRHDMWCAYLRTYLRTYVLTYLLTYLRTYSLTHLLTYSPTHLLTYSPTHLLTYSRTHVLTYPLTHLFTALQAKKKKEEIVTITRRQDAEPLDKRPITMKELFPKEFWRI